MLKEISGLVYTHTVVWYFSYTSGWLFSAFQLLPINVSALLSFKNNARIKRSSAESLNGMVGQCAGYKKIKK